MKSAGTPFDVDATVDSSDLAIAEPSSPSGSSEEPTGPLVTERLGQGGNAEVVLGVQASLGREVAIKRLLPERRTPGARLRLVEEARLAGRLEHPNVIPIHDLRTGNDGWPYLVMKRVQGRTWKRVLAEDRDERGTLPEHVLEKHLRIVLAVCHAVHFAHSRGVIHCDLKPSNVMLGDHGETYVVDWGSALALEPGTTSMELPPRSSVRGTAHYLAPELARAPRGTTVDARVDVYSIGAIVAELLLGLGPAAGTRPEDVITARQSGAIDPIVQQAPGKTGLILRRALAADPLERHPSVEALRRDLEEFLQHRAAISLGDEARQRLAQLRSSVQGEPTPEVLVEIDNAFIECRFACRESLRRWPDQDDVLETLDEAHRAMAELALRRGNPQGAAVLLRGMRRPAPDLQERVDALLRRGSLDARELEALRHDARERDITKASPVRRRTMMFGGLALTPVVLAAPEVLGYELRHWHMLGGAIGFLFGVSVIMFRLRSRIVVNLATRALVGLLFVETLMYTAVVAGGWLWDAEVVATLAVAFLVLSAANAVAAWLSEPRFAVGAAVQLVAVISLLARPDVAGIIWLVTIPLTLIVIGMLPPRSRDGETRARRGEVASSRERGSRAP